MRILFKILLIPFALVFMFLSFIIDYLSYYLARALGIVAGLFALAFFMYLVTGIKESNMQTANLIMCAVAGTLIALLSAFIQSLGTNMARFSAWVWAM